MGLRLHTQQELLTNLVAALEQDREVALWLGAPMSAPSQVGGPGVPTARAMVELVREALAPYPRALAEVERALSLAEWGAEYGAAMDVLRTWGGPDDVAGVIRRAVRMGRLPVARDLPDDGELELDLEGWHLPPGTAALGEMLAAGLGGLRGPVITVNFDPLLSIAIKRAGGRVERRLLDEQGYLPRPGHAHGEIEVVHLHGYWRDPETLISPPSRRRLAEGLKVLLQDHTVLVLGTGSHNDVATQALLDVALDDEAQVTVVQAFHASERGTVRAGFGQLLELAGGAPPGAGPDPLMRQGRFKTYGGIDCHAFFCGLKAALTPVVEEVPEPPPPVEVPGIVGWTPVTRSLLTEAGEAGLDAFLSGREPDWALIERGRLAKRDRAREITSELGRQARRDRGWSAHLLLGPEGEGKSTVARQVAAVMGRRDDAWRVWWRDGGALRWDQVGPACAGAKRLLLVIDDAHELRARGDLDRFLDPQRLPRRLERCGAQVHLLLCATAHAWREASKAKPRWLDDPAVVAHRGLRALGSKEAQRIAEALEARKALGRLSDLPPGDARAQRLVELTEARTDLVLLGALIEARTGESLQTHVAAHLGGLRGKRSTRFPRVLRALLAVAATHAVGLGGLDHRVLRALLELEPDGLHEVLDAGSDWLRSERQGRGHVVRSRHPALSATMLSVLDDLKLGTDRAEVYAGLARAAIAGVPRHRKERRILAFAKLWRHFLEAGDAAVSVAVAEAAATAAPADAGFVGAFARTLREIGQPARGRQVCETWAARVRAEDADAPLHRTVLQEWSACTAVDPSHPDHAAWTAWLALLAISDQAGRPVEKDAIPSVLWVAEALRVMDPDGAEARAIQGRAAAVVVLDRAPPGSLSTGQRQRRDGHREATGGLDRVLSLGAAGACLTGVTRLAWERTAVEQRPSGLPEDGRLTFCSLVEMLEQGEQKREARRHQQPRRGPRRQEARKPRPEQGAKEGGGKKRKRRRRRRRGPRPQGVDGDSGSGT